MGGVHSIDLNSTQEDPGAAKCLESQHGSGTALDRTMVLFHDIVEILDLISLVGSPVASRQRGPRRTVRAGFPRIRLEHSVKRRIDAGLARLRKPFASITLSIRLIAETKGAEP